MLLDELGRRAERLPGEWAGFATLFFLLQGTGLRISEARGLVWDAVDLDQKVLEVRQRADAKSHLGRVKSRAAYRIVVLDGKTAAWLTRWRPHCPKGELGLVFPNQRGRPESYQNLYHRRWKPLCGDLGLLDAAGTPLFAFHSARHYRVSELIHVGANVREIMGEIGHASSALTLDRYGHLFPEELSLRRERAERIAEQFGRKSDTKSDKLF